MFASPSKAAPSGVTTERSNVFVDVSDHLLDGAPIDSGSPAISRPRATASSIVPTQEERPLGEVVVLALDDLDWNPLIVSSSRTYLPGVSGERLGDEERLREEALDLAGPGDDDLVLVRELVDAEDGDDVLEVLVALQDLLHARRRPVVLVGDDAGLEEARDRVERVDRRIDPLLGDRA